MMMKRIWTLLMICFPFYLWSQTAEWVQTAIPTGGESKSTIYRAMDVGPDGNIVVAGRFSETVTISVGEQFTSAGMTDIVLTKYTPEGVLIWSHRYGGPFAEDVYDVHIANSGAIYLSGEFQDSTAIGEHFLTSNNYFDKSFVARFTEDGEPEWLRRTASSSLSIDTDDDGNLLVCGELMATIEFMGDSLSSTGNEDIYVAKFSPLGDLIWVRTTGALLSDVANNVAVGENGNIYVGGESEAGFSFADTPVPNGFNHMFVLKYSAAGDELWILNGTGTPTGINKVMDYHPEWGLITGGITYLTFSIGDFEIGTSSFEPRLFLFKCQPDGTPEWLVGTLGEPLPQDLSIADNGDIYTISTISSSTFVNEEPIQAPGLGTLQIIILKYHSDGTLATYFQLGGEDHERAQFLHAVSDNEMYFGGGFTGLAELGGIEIGESETFTPNAFVAKLNSFPVGISHQPEPDINMYPNPANELLFISGTDILQVEIFDLSGRKLLTFENSTISGGINIDHLAPGTYLIVTDSKNGKSTNKLIVQ